MPDYLGRGFRSADIEVKRPWTPTASSTRGSWVCPSPFGPAPLAHELSRLSNVSSSSTWAPAGVRGFDRQSRRDRRDASTPPPALPSTPSRPGYVEFDAVAMAAAALDVARARRLADEAAR